MPQISVKIDEQTKQFLDQIAADTNRSTHSLAGQALKEFTERYSKRIAYLKEGVQAASDYEIDGLHLSHEEMSNWAQDFANGKPTPIPTPHV